MIRSFGSKDTERLWRVSVRGITADTALRLAKYFGTSVEFWLNLQSHYELDRAEDRAGQQIAAFTPREVA